MYAYLLASVIIAAGPSFEVRTLDGTSFTGRLTQIGNEGVTLETESGPVSLKADRLLRVNSRRSISDCTVSKIAKTTLLWSFL